jgi:hypothetical protein
MRCRPPVRAVSGVAHGALLLRERDQQREEAGIVGRAVHDGRNPHGRRPHAPLREADYGELHDVTREPLYSSPPGGRAGSSSVAGRPKKWALGAGQPTLVGEPMLADTTSGFPVPASASPYASVICSSAAATASIPPEGSRSCLCATWMTPSESAAAALSPSRSEISPRRTLAPSADTAAADLSDRARAMTSWPAAMRSEMIYGPEWPVPPVTKTRILLSF